MPDPCVTSHYGVREFFRDFAARNRIDMRINQKIHDPPKPDAEPYLGSMRCGIDGNWVSVTYELDASQNKLEELCKLVAERLRKGR